MTFDWTGLQIFLEKAITTAVRCVHHDHPEVQLQRAAFTDFYTEKLLVLWPTIAVTAHRDNTAPSSWRWQFEADDDGDEWAAQLTIHAGTAGTQWSTVIDQFFDHVVAAAKIATATLVAERIVVDDFVVIAADADRDLTVHCVTEQQLAANYPHLHQRQLTITALQRLPTQAQVSQLLSGLLVASPNDPIEPDDRIELLTRIGEPAAIAAAQALTEPTGAIEHLARIIDNVAVASPDIVGSLRNVLLRDASGPRTQQRVATSLAWLGRLDIVINSMSILADDALYAAIATPYLSARKNGPLDYAPLEAALDVAPHLHQRLYKELSPIHMYAIDAGDLPTAITGLSSRWQAIRRHAAIVMLSIHL